MSDENDAFALWEMYIIISKIVLFLNSTLKLFNSYLYWQMMYLCTIYACFFYWKFNSVP